MLRTNTKNWLNKYACLLAYVLVHFYNITKKLSMARKAVRGRTFIIQSLQYFYFEPCQCTTTDKYEIKTKPETSDHLPQIVLFPLRHSCGGEKVATHSLSINVYSHQQCSTKREGKV